MERRQEGRRRRQQLRSRSSGIYGFSNLRTSGKMVEMDDGQSDTTDRKLGTVIQTYHLPS